MYEADCGFDEGARNSQLNNTQGLDIFCKLLKSLILFCKDLAMFYFFYVFTKKRLQSA